MKWYPHRLLVPAFAIVLVFGAASAALAQSSAIGGGGAGLVQRAPADQAKALAAQAAQRGIVPSSYGVIDATIYQIPAAAFKPRQGAATYVTDSDAGTTWLTDLGGTLDDAMWAPVYLPAGAQIDFFDVYACDGSTVGNHVQAFFSGYPALGDFSVTDFTFLITTSDAGVPCQYFSNAISHTINNNVEFASGYHYAVNVRFLALDGTNKLKGVDLWWRRQVSPAPGTATFTDVATSHPYFQFIEALRASSITTGCQASPAKYCPDQFVTRGQMAVFLARALGLHWPL